MLRSLTTLLLSLAAVAPPVLSQQSGTIQGQITDSTGASIPGASVTAAGPGAFRKATTTDANGAFTFAGLPAGSYTLHVAAPGFGPQDAAVEVAPGAVQARNFSLQVALEKQEVTVKSDSGPQVSTEASSNASQLVLSGQDLDALPDDPDDLAADLQALAGPAAGPNGGQIYVDGFTDAQLPPKASIREIRINQNPFSAEYDRLGFGRIEILTKPGTDKLRGQVFYSGGDALFNSRNPYSATKPDFTLRHWGGNVSGPLSKRASFFFSFYKRDIDDNAVANVQVVDPTTLAIQRQSDAWVTPIRRTDLSPRLDYQLSTNNTLTVRYNYEHDGRDNAGLDQFSLLSRAYSMFDNEHNLRVTETAVLGAHVVNETRFSFTRESSGTNTANNEPAINVLQAFSGGGAQIGNGYDRQNRWQLHNYTSVMHGSHTVRFGVRFRATTLSDSSPQNFGGTYTFSGGLAPVLDADNQPVLGPDGQPELAQITSIERYRRTLLFQQRGLTPAQVRALGGGASQFSIAAGNPLASLSQVDVGPFVQDDWRVRPNFTLSLGFRYEGQTNIHDWRDFAPRFGFAWAPGGSARRNGKTVIRGGFGMFYDRVRDDLALQALRYNGINQQQYIVENPDFYPAIPAVDALNALPLSTYRLASDLRAPYVEQAALGIERQLPHNTTVASTFTYSRAEHLLLTRNINAPLPGGGRPLGDVGDVFQYESSGRLKQNQWITNVTSRFTRNVTFFGFYVLNHAASNTDGYQTLPANQYNLASEWGRSSLDVRHRVVLGGSLLTRYGIRLSPFVIAHSGQPFNITVGRDLNGDLVYTDRPALAADLSKPNLVPSPWGLLDPSPSPGETIIPRNFGQSPGQVSVNLRLSKTWGFGSPKSGRNNYQGGGGGGHYHGPGPGAMTMGGGPGGGMHSLFSDSMTEKRYNLTLSASARNIINHTNPGPIVGNMTSPFFGQSTTLAGGWGPASSAGNRRIELQLRFSF